jgi:hypothetical protein
MTRTTDTTHTNTVTTKHFVPRKPTAARSVGKNR